MLFLTLLLSSAVAVALSTPSNYSWGTCLCLSATAVNVRSGACTSYSVVGRANKGECYKSKASKLTNCGYVWYKVDFKGRDAWIAGNFLISKSSCSKSTGGSTGSSLCTASNIQLAGRIVYGEARGESAEGQLAVAWTIVNRVSHRGYPSSFRGVAYAKYGSHYEYNTLDEKAHDRDWASSKASNDATYRNAIKAASDALCNRKPDPTTCATDYCAYDPCSATKNNIYWDAYNKKKIGNHWFVCRKAKNG